MVSSCLEARETASSFASAYALGPMESGAAINLLRHIPKAVKTALTDLVRTYIILVFLLTWMHKWSGLAKYV